MRIPVKYFDEVKGRECGKCIACCIWLGIEELKKPVATKCKHLRGSVYGHKRCGIYASRPGACSEYWCLWLAGFGPDEWQPNKCGILVTVYPDPDDPDKITFTMNVTDEEKARPVLREYIAQVVTIPKVSELRVIHVKEQKALVFKNGNVYNCKLLPSDPKDIEGLQYAMVSEPIGRYRME